MARNKGIFPFAANFEVKAASPLDPRVLVENKSELISKDTWPLDGDTLYIYKGLLVSVQEERAIYMLVDPDKILETDYSGWERKDGSSPGAVSYEDIYIIEGLTAQDIYMFEGGILNIDGRDLSEAINSNKRVYIKYSNNAGKAGIIPCSAYKEDVYYVSFRLGSSLYGFDIGADSQYIDETSMFHIDIQEKLESGENIKRINGQSILGRGEITIEGLPSAIPDWNENDPSAASYIKNRTHYEVEHEITNGFTLVGFLYNKCKYDEDTDGYYTTSDIKIRYNEDDYEGTIIIQKGTLLGYDNFNDEVTITGEDQGEEFEFTSYIEDYNIYLKVSNPLGGTNFRLLEYTTLDDAYIPDTIARKSDLENIGGGGSADSGEITEIKTTLDSHNELIEDLQNMKIDKENDDYYPNMSVGVADNLSGVDVVASEFTSRQSGGGAILDGTARIEAIKGNSIIWNQLTKYPEFGPADGWYKSGGPDASSVTITIIEPHDTKVEWEVQVKAPQGFSSGGSFFITPNIPLKNGHKYFYSFDIKKNTTVNTGVYFGNVWANFGDVIADSWHTFHYFVEPTDNFDRVLYLYPFNGLGSTAAEQELIALIKNLVTYDLTQMFGAGNEPTTVEEFYARMPIEINTSLYNKGQMINLNPSGIKSYSANEEPIERFQDLSLIGTLFPDGMKSVGEFHDEIRYNKETQKWEKITRIGEVDLGSLNWGYSGSLGYFYSSPSEDIGDGNTFKETNKQVVLINSADFTGLHWSAFTDNYVSPRNNAISLFYTPDWDAVRANILCNEYTDAASFKEYLQGKKAYFVLNDPIVEEIDFDGNLDYQVWNGGTEELVADNPTAPLRADIAYGFNAVGKIKELEEKINSGGGGGVSKEYVDTKVTELSTQVGKVSDAVANKVQKGSLATINGQSIEEGGNIVIEGGGGEPSQYIKDASKSADGNTLTLTKKDGSIVSFSPSGGGGGGSTTDLTAVAKWGVLTQTLKSVGNNNEGYVVQVSNPTYGWIPQSFIDEVTNFGGIATNANAGYITGKPIFNAETGYFEYQGITNLAYDEMRAAYTVGRNMFSNGIGNYLYAVQYRDNITSGVSDKLRCILHYPTFNEMGHYRLHGFCRYLKFLEIGVVNEAFGTVSVINDGLNYAFTGCSTLRSCGYFEVSQLKSTPFAFTGNPSLESVYLKGLKVNVNLGSSPLLKEDCILYMIQNAATTGITITLHPTAYDRAMSNEEITAAMESKQVNLASA